MGKEKLLDTIKRLGKVSGATDKLKDAQNAAGTSLPIYTEREGQKIKMIEVQHPDGRMSSYPPVELWDDWQEYDGKLWPQKVARHYSLVPTICFNCESGCGLLAYVDKDTLKYASLKAIPRIQVHGAETALKDRPPTIKSMTPNVFCIRSNAWANGARASGNVFRGPSP